MAKRVLFVASNPSAKSPDCSAMHPSTRSRKILDGWLKDITIDAIYTNVSNVKTTENKPLDAANILNNLHYLELKIAAALPDHIIALGDTASRALKLLGVPHTRIEHPSGLNRKLNNSKNVEAIKLTLRQISLGIIT